MASGTVQREPLIKFIAVTGITLNQGGIKVFDLSSYIPDGYSLWSVNVTIKGTDGKFYQLPWIASDGSSTCVNTAPVDSSNPKSISIKDLVGGWGTTNMYVTAFLQPV